jgi:cytochrome b561
MTPWRNDARHFGRTSRALHWAMAALMLAQIPLGLVLVRMTPSLSTLWLFSLHKSLGFTLLVLAVLRLVWHRISPPPAPLGDAGHWTNRLARGVHRLLYAAMIVVPLSGWVGASASGIETVVYGGLTLPAIAPESEAWQDAGFLVHSIATKVLIAALVLHVAGAARRALAGDGTLRRMLRGAA